MNVQNFNAIGDVTCGDYLEKRIADLNKKIDPVIEPIADLIRERDLMMKFLAEYRISGLNSTSATSKIDESLKDKPLKNIRWRSEAIRFIQKYNRLLSTDDIFDFITSGYWMTPGERRKLKSTLSNALNGLCRARRIKSYDVAGRKGYVYGLPDMFENNEPKKEYKQMIAA